MRFAETGTAVYEQWIESFLVLGLGTIIAGFAFSSNENSILTFGSAPARRKLFFRSSAYSRSSMSADILLSARILKVSPSRTTDWIIEKFLSALVRFVSPCIMVMHIVRARSHSPFETMSIVSLLILNLIFQSDVSNIAKISQNRHSKEIFLCLPLINNRC